MAVAVVSGLLGNWYALPASTTMCIVLCLAFRSGCRRTQRREVVKLVDQEVSNERGHSFLDSRCALPRDLTCVLLEERVSDAREHLFLCADQQKMEVGEFLDTRERHELADKLRDLVRSAGNIGLMSHA